MWFGLLHLISANLVMWVAAVVIEAYEGFHHSISSHETEDHTTENNTTTESSHVIHKRESGEHGRQNSLPNNTLHWTKRPSTKAPKGVFWPGPYSIRNFPQFFQLSQK